MLRIIFHLTQFLLNLERLKHLSQKVLCCCFCFYLNLPYIVSKLYVKWIITIHLLICIYKQIHVSTPQPIFSSFTGQPEDICLVREMTPNLPVYFILVLKHLCSSSPSTGMISLQFGACEINTPEQFPEDLHKLKDKYSNNRCLIFARNTHGFTALQCIPDSIYTLIKHLL